MHFLRVFHGHYNYEPRYYFKMWSLISHSIRVRYSYFVAPAMLGFAYILYLALNLRFLNVTDSDFLTAFPNGKISRLLGVQDQLFRNSLAEAWMGNGGNWNYGPLHVFLTIPLHFFPSIKAATDFLFFFLLALYILAIQICIKLYSEFYNLRVSSILIYLICLFNYPFLSAIHQRNLEIIELFIVSLAMLLWRRKMYFQSGMLIGLAVGIKFLPAIIILCFIFSRQKRALLGFAIMLIPQLLFIQFYLGWQNSYTLNLLVKGSGEPPPLRQGLFDVLTRIFGSTLGQNMVILSHIILVLMIFLVSIGLLNYFKVKEFLEQSWEIWPTILSLGVVLAPHSNNYYFCLLMPLIIQGRFLVENRTYSQKLIYAISLFLLSAPMPLAIMWRLVNNFGHVINIHSPDATPMISLLNRVLTASPLFIGAVLLLILTRCVWNPRTLQAETINEDTKS